MTQALNRWFPPLTLAVWGSLLLYFAASGRLAAFLHPSFRPGVWIAGAGLLLLALGAGVGGGTACCEEEACGHSVGRFTWGKVLAFATLLLPLGLAFLSSRDGFGQTAIENRGVVTDASALAGRPGPVPELDEFLAKTPEGAVKVSVMDLLYAAQEPTLRQQLTGRTVEVIGQLMDETNANPYGNRMRLVRMFMNCCAADARPIAVLAELPQKTEIPSLSWVRVTGVPTFPVEGGKPLTVLKVASMEVTPPPEETMLY